MSNFLQSRTGRLVSAAAVAVLGLVAWRYWPGTALPDGIVSGNGRIEATQVDVAAKAGGRIEDILVNEGDFVTADQVVGHMDLRTLQARLTQARAQVLQAQSAKASAVAQVAQREADRATTQALLLQRQADNAVAIKTNQRAQALLAERATSAQEADDQAARAQSTAAAVNVAKAQQAATEAGIAAARAQVLQAQAAVEAAQAAVAGIEAEIADGTLRAPRAGRVQYRVAQPGEVVGPGGKVVSLVDVGDVYMTLFLPETVSGRIALGAEVRIVLDAAPQYVIPAKVSYVASVAQFTPKTVETQSERQKMVFRVKARIEPALLQKHLEQVKTGIPGIAYVRLDAAAPWPAALANPVQ